MNEDVSTSILLKITSDLEGIKQMQAQFSALQQKTKDAGKEVESLGSKLQSMSSSSVFGLAAAFKVSGMSIDAMVGKIQEAVTGTSTLAHEMKQVTRATGLAGEAAQVLAKGGKVSMDELTTKLQRYRQIIGQAVLDPGGSVDKFLKEKLGLDAVTLSAKPMQVQLEMVAQAFGKVQNSSERAALAGHLFGRGAGAMLVLLDNLRKDGFEKLKEEVKATAGVLSEDMSAAILKQEKVAEHANNRLSISFAETNLQMLEMKAKLAVFMADHAAAIGSVGKSLAATSLALGALGGLSQIPWGKMGTQYGGLMGATFGLALAGAIVLAIAAAMQEAIDKQDKRLDSVTGRAHRAVNKVNNARTPEEAQSGLNEAANMRNDFVQQAAVLAKKKVEWIKSGASGLSGNDQDMLNQLTKAIHLMDTVVKRKSPSAVSDAAGRKFADEDAAAREAANVAAEKLHKTVKETANQDERDLLLLKSSDGTLKEKKDALDQVLILVEAEFSEKEKAFDLIKNSAVGEQALTDLTAQKIKMELPYLKAREALLKQERQEADRARAKIYTDASELEQRTEKALIDSIKQNEYLTDRQKKAALLLIYKKEEQQIDAQIAAADLKVVTSEKDKDATGKAAAEAEAKRLRDRKAGIGNDVAAHTEKSTFQEASAGFTKLQNSFATIGTSISSIMGSAISSISNGIQGLINRTMTWGQAFRSVVGGIASSAVKSLSDMAAQGIMHWVAMQLGMTTASTVGAGTRTAIHGAEHAASVAGSLWSGAVHIATEIGKTVATAVNTAIRIGHHIAEALASVFKAGVAALDKFPVPFVGPLLGIAAMGAIIGLGLGIVGKISKGFSEGGYTGDGAEHQSAGEVHKGEVVFSQRDVSRGGGVAAVERMRLSGGSSGRGAGLSTGAGAGSAGGALAGGKAGGVNIAYHNTRQDAETWLQSQRGRRLMIDFVRQTQTEL